MKPKIIFFGNGPLADWAKSVLVQKCDIIFHARKKEDLEIVKKIKHENPEVKGVLASFGVMIKSDILNLFESDGILNIHPSLLPLYRGSSPIESAMLNGDTVFSVSVMKLVKTMDAGPIYYQASFELGPDIPKEKIYETLAKAGANWTNDNINSLPIPFNQDDEKATFTCKFDTSMSNLDPSKTAYRLYNEVRAFQKYPKSKYIFYGIECTILEAHISNSKTLISIECADGKYLAIDRLQPESRKPMDAKSFINGYKK